jgi:hypothetical protein
MQATQRTRVSQAALLLAAIAILVPQHAAAQSPVYSVIYSFKGGDDGFSPYGGLLQYKTGPLYGTTYYGGTGTMGTVFELTAGRGAPGRRPCSTISAVSMDRCLRPTWFSAVVERCTARPRGVGPPATMEARCSK